MKGGLVLCSAIGDLKVGANGSLGDIIDPETEDLAGYR